MNYREEIQDGQHGANCVIKELRSQLLMLNSDIAREVFWDTFTKSINPTLPLKCHYEQDNTTSMNCKHCGRAKWLH